MPCKVWHETTYPFSNFSGCSVEVCEWISYFTHTIYIKNGSNYLSILKLKLIHFRKRGPWCHRTRASVSDSGNSLPQVRTVSVFGNKIQWNKLIFTQENTLDNAVVKLASILFRTPNVDTQRSSHNTYLDTAVDQGYILEQGRKKMVLVPTQILAEAHTHTYARACTHSFDTTASHRWLSAKLQYFYWLRTGNTAVLH